MLNFECKYRDDVYIHKHQMSKRARPVSISSRRVKPKKTHESKAYIRAAIQEVKYTDANFALNPTFTGTNCNLTVAAQRGQGGYNNFIGNTITPKSLEIRWTIIGCTYSAFLASDAYNTTRVIVHQWMDADVPLSADILQYSGDGWAPYSPYQIESLKKMRVLKDFHKVTYSANCEGTSTNSTSTCVSGKIVIPGSKLRPLTFAPTTNTCINGNIYLYVASDSGTPPSPGIIFNSRLTFYD